MSSIETVTEAHHVLRLERPDGIDRLLAELRRRHPEITEALDRWEKEWRDALGNRDEIIYALGYLVITVLEPNHIGDMVGDVESLLRSMGVNVADLLAECRQYQAEQREIAVAVESFRSEVIGAYATRAAEMRVATEDRNNRVGQALDRRHRERMALDDAIHNEALRVHDAARGELGVIADGVQESRTSLDQTRRMMAMLRAAIKDGVT